MSQQLRACGQRSCSGASSSSSAFGGRRQAAASSRSSVAASSMGGRGRGQPGGGFGGDSPLILGGRNPGAPGGGPGGGRLILPGEQRFGGGGQQQRPPPPPMGLDGPEPSSGPGQLPPAHKYRPPPGFMNENAVDPSLSQADPQEMISKLRNGAGPWHQLAKFLPVLYAKGFDTNTISELTGINPVDQNTWLVGSTVYESIEATGKVDASVLAHFNSDGDTKLYHFRFLPAERRAAAAVYIRDRGLEPQGCEMLARAMKEWDRRPGERKGFNNSPGDCMAFKHLRDAVESRITAEAAEKLALAFAAVESDEARARLTEWQDTELAERTDSAGSSGASNSNRPVLMVLRLSGDELGFRPLPQITELTGATVDELQRAPRTTQEGAFGAFELQAGGQPGQKWVALPQWKALALARHPVAIPLADCAADPAVLAASLAKTAEEKKKLRGVGLLVVDVEGQRAELDASAHYLVTGAAGQRQALQLVPGASLVQDGLQGGEVVATVLFLVRPPNRESAITSAELLQL